MHVGYRIEKNTVRTGEEYGGVKSKNKRNKRDKDEKEMDGWDLRERIRKEKKRFFGVSVCYFYGIKSSFFFLIGAIDLIISKRKN